MRTESRAVASSPKASAGAAHADPLRLRSRVCSHGARIWERVKIGSWYVLSRNPSSRRLVVRSRGTLDRDQGQTRMAGATGWSGPIVGTRVESDFPPSVAIQASHHTLARCLVAVACMLALMLIGFVISGHSHAGDVASQYAASAASIESSHCAEPCGAGAPGHCHGGIHTHACCILLPAAASSAAPSAAGWRPSRKPSVAGIMISPIPRPPAFLVA